MWSIKGNSDKIGSKLFFDPHKEILLYNASFVVNNKLFNMKSFWLFQFIELQKFPAIKQLSN